MIAAVVIDLDKSVLLQMVIFAVLIVVLKPLLFDPVLRVFTLREERTEGERKQARKLQVRAAELLEQYEHELARVQRTAAEERERARSETARLEAEIVDEARRVSQGIADEGRQRIDAEVKSIRRQLERDTTVMARQIATQVLGRELGS
jgi:F-type H+-transporting ATPase subunit b